MPREGWHDQTIADIGEKALIREFIRPFFSPEGRPESIGDDCAVLQCPSDCCVLLSTDRVPADLTAFRLGILDYEGLGRYLATLNLSDIAASGGSPTAMLLTFGLPDSMLFRDFRSLCEGVRDATERVGCPIVGGDLSASEQISLAATVVGLVRSGNELRRRGARVGDKIFVSRPLGVTCAALHYFTRGSSFPGELSEPERQELARQFTSLKPMFELSRWLVEERRCTSCMDNTDGIGQSLSELAEASAACFVLDEEALEIPALVSKIARELGTDRLTVALGPGADFSLVGTLRGDRTGSDLAPAIRVIGAVEEGSGVEILRSGHREPLQIAGWNYFLRGDTQRV